MATCGDERRRRASAIDAGPPFTRARPDPARAWARARTWARASARARAHARAPSKAVRDTSNDTRIDFLFTGELTGDGKPKPVAFPEPKQAALIGTDFHVLALPRLVELKLASAMTAPHRGHDFFDIVELVRRASLPAELANELDPYVRESFAKAWALAQHDDDEY